MSSSRIAHSTPLNISKHSENLLWCVQNLTQDFLAEALRAEDSKKYKKFVSLTSSFPFRIKNWINQYSDSDSLTSSIEAWDSSDSTNFPVIGQPFFNRYSVRYCTSNTLPFTSASSLHYSLRSAPVHPGFVSYSTKSKQPFEDSKSISIPSIPLTPELSLNQLISIISGKPIDPNSPDLYHLVEDVLAAKDVETVRRFQKIRVQVYQYLIKNKNPQRLHIIEKIYSSISPKRLTKKDLAAKLQCITELEPERISKTLTESLRLFSHKFVLELLFSTIKQLQKLPIPSALAPAITDKSLFSFQLFSSILLKQLGTLKLSNMFTYKTERTILTDMVFFENPRDLLRILKTLLDDKPKTNSLLVTTIIDILTKTYRFELAVDLWNLKCQLGLASSLDLYYAMKSYIKMKLPDEALLIYNSNPRLHNDWLFDIVLEAYGKKEDWIGMRQVFDSLFGRGELPNLNHYRIVMEAISKIAQTDVIEFMYNNMLSRNLNPTVSIYNAIMYGQYALGDLDGVKKAFGMLNSSGLSPDTSSYNIMLMTYRDLKDLDSALEVLQMATAKEHKISRVIITTILSLCAERKDPVNGQIVFNWILESGGHPDLTSYNALLHCYAESKSKVKFKELYRRMRKLKFPLRIDTATILFSFYSETRDIVNLNNLVKTMDHEKIPQDKIFYSTVLKHLCDSNNMEQAEQVIETMSQSSEKPDVYHYSILMDGYLNHKNYAKVFSIYESLPSLGIDPSFHTSAILLQALQLASKKSPELKGKSKILLTEYLDEKDTVDLTSSYWPRYAVPPELSKVVARSYADGAKPDEIIKVMEKMQEQHGPGNVMEGHIVLMRKLLEAYGKARDWDNFNRYWTIFFEAQRKFYVPKEVFDEENREKKTIDVIPYKDRFSNDEIFRYKIFQITSFGEYSNVIEFLEIMRSEGYIFSNSLINMTIRLLVEEEVAIVDAYRLVSIYLIKHQLARYSLRPLVRKKTITLEEYNRKIGQYNIQQETMGALIRNFPRLIDATIRASGEPDFAEKDALHLLFLQLGQTIRLFYEISTRTKFPFRQGKKQRRDALANMHNVNN
ncbi:uncharacterized protein SAPINGB_P005111 [Magnusiomyces paraingens]|uniref:Pentacotripeptide-repeat region of PRORP domain-containing protein n=1 Tax=Magnusiomyces paraingens TaxID=2606893 RepID=A0A5E8BZG2_9ASCO|nr:uncharacterized protein SAPINGB_P005111 [Saprochaete ingens]VVT56502.1 unnamed protein product [Saprochaete ingens]